MHIPYHPYAPDLVRQLQQELIDAAQRDRTAKALRRARRKSRGLLRRAGGVDVSPAATRPARRALA